MGSFDEGSKLGEGKMLYQNGDVYQGEWWDDVRAGNGVITF